MWTNTQQETIHAERQIWQDHVIRPLLLCGFTVSSNHEPLYDILMALFEMIRPNSGNFHPRFSASLGGNLENQNRSFEILGIQHSY